MTAPETPPQTTAPSPAFEPIPSPTLLAQQRTIWREELTIHYDQLKTLDENLYRYSSVIFTINAALLAFIAQLLTANVQAPDWLIYLFIGFLGYASAICMGLIALKGFYTWELKTERIQVLEHDLGYQIAASYEQSLIHKKYWPARNLSISRIRLFFNWMLAAIWFFLIMVFPLLTNTRLFPWLYCFIYIAIIALIAFIPLAIIYGSRWIAPT